MKICYRVRLCLFSLIAIGGSLLLATATWAQDLRIVNWNIDADTGGSVGQMGGVDGGPGLIAVLQAIGQEHLAGNAQPIDILALQELNGTGVNAVNADNATLQYVTGQLNAIYGAGTYAYDTATDPTTGSGDTGNGPSGLIYNTKTVMDLSATVIGTPSSSAASRAPMLYELAPLANPSDTFYLDVEHAKSGTGSDNDDRREAEASEVRAATASLGPNANIIYSGDFNLNASTDASYLTMTKAGNGQGFDPANPAENWTDTSTYRAIMTESATGLQYRDDVQFVTGSVLNGTNGLHLVPGSYTAFGNNGSTSFDSAVNNSSNTALSDLPNRLSILNDLTTATDHLPIVADYAFLTPEPSSLMLMAAAAIPLLWAGQRRYRKPQR